MRYLTGILLLGFCIAVFAAGCNKDDSSGARDSTNSNPDTAKTKGKGKGKGGLEPPPKIE
jgi:hypothetical protein